MYKLGFQTLLQSLRDFQSYHSFSELTLIVDSIGKNHDRDVLVAYQKALQSFDGHPGFYRKRFSPSIIFADSEFTCGLQVVDYCAASIQRSVEADDPTYASIIKPRLFANEKGIQYGYGFKWIPEK